MDKIHHRLEVNDAEEMAYCSVRCCFEKLCEESLQSRKAEFLSGLATILKDMFHEGVSLLNFGGAVALWIKFCGDNFINSSQGRKNACLLYFTASI